MKNPLFPTLLLVFTGSLAVAQTLTCSPANTCFANPNASIGTVTVTNTTSANSFSWSVAGPNCTGSVLAASGLTAQVQYNCCGTQTVTCVGYVNSTPSWTAHAYPALHCPPTVSITAANGTVMCAGTTNTLHGWGAQTYTWMPGVGFGATMMIFPPASTCYSLMGTNAWGCTDTETICILVNPTPLISMPPSTAVCAGQSALLNPAVSGAASYSWNTGATTPSILVNPSSGTCYTLEATGASGCAKTATTCVIVNALPTVFVVGTPSVCLGQAATLNAAGAVTYTWLPGPVYNYSATVFPNTSTVYSVIAYDGTCTVTNTTQVTVAFPPVASVSGNTHVCLGSSTTLSVTATGPFIWDHNSSTSPTLHVLPTANMQFTVTTTGTNGCQDSLIVDLLADSTCAVVWPGDANSDGAVNATDVLELGLQASATGPARSPGGNSFTGQMATTWVGSGSNSQNICHADCNGDGVVDAADTLAIQSNFSMTHSFRSSGSGGNGNEITLEAPESIPNGGGWTTVDIVLGSSGSQVTDVYGLAFELSFDPSVIDNNQVYVRYPASFINPSNQVIPFRRIAPGSGVANCAIVRTDGNNVSGFGKIGELVFKTKPGASGTISFSASNALRIDAGGATAQLTGSTAEATFTPVGISEAELGQTIRIYPNPASSTVYLTNSGNKPAGYRITDICGRLLMAGELGRQTVVDVSGLSPAVYSIRVETSGGSVIRKLIIGE